MPVQDTPARRWSRKTTVENIVSFGAAQEAGTSQRAYAAAAGVPRATLQRWVRRLVGLEASPALRAFMESPDGLAFLHGLVVAIVFVMVFVAGCGVRPVSEVLHLAGLSPFMACSRGYVAQVVARVEAEIVAFAATEKERLAAEMATHQEQAGRPVRPITVVQDETYHHGRPVLVTIEPVANFLLVESYAPRVDAAAWDAAMVPTLTSLPVRLVQSISDEGKALLKHVATTLGVAHGTDIFHLQREIARTTSAPLARQVTDATAAHAKAGAEVATARQAGDDQALAWAEGVEGATQAALTAAQRRQDEARAARLGLSTAYHLVDLTTGALRTPAQVEQDVNAQFDKLQALAQEADLPSYSHEGIAKARRLVPTLVQTMIFVHQQLDAQLAAHDLTADEADLVRTHLLPAAYLHRAARQAPHAAARADRRQLAARLHADAAPHLAALAPDRRALLPRIAQDVADLFQRASSCVEGRNGHLALRHHSLHCLSDTRLAALTAIHNFHVRRPDGTTAAERFFGAKPRDLFAHLLAHLPLPARPGGTRQTASRVA